MRHVKFMEIARLIAEQSQCMPQHGALLVKGNRILAASCNIKKTHPIFLRYHHQYVKTIHAEARLLLNKNVENCTLYSARNINGEFGISKPCQTCMALIIESGIRTIIYWDKGLEIARLY